MQTFAINTDYDTPLKSEHVAFYTTERHEGESVFVSLVQVVRNTYKHPDAPEDAVISVLEEVTLKTVKTTSREAKPLLLFQNLEQTMKEVQHIS